MKPPRFRCDRPSELPDKYKFLGVLGEGVYGKVVQCLNVETNETVAIKMPKLRNKNEISVLEKREKRKRKSAPMLLSDIRTIIEQTATTFDVLKGIQMIHADFKLDNIMMVDHRQRPFQVKLIDFGEAVFTAKARRFETLQAQCIRSPEIMLRQEYDEAIDMWSLGCAMFQMICGHSPFSGENNYEVMQSIVELLGQPADHVIDRDGCSMAFFIQNEKERSWRIKTPLEYFRRRHRRAQKRHEFQSLDDMKMMRLEKDNEAEAVEREQCIELLKAMLTFDSKKRITPREVLTHPFITKDYPNVQTDMVKTSRSLGSTSSSEPFECLPPATPLRDEDSINIQPDDCTLSPEILPSGVILVCPVTYVKMTLLEDQKSIVSEPPAAPLRDEDSFHIQTDDCTQSPEILPSGAILVRPVTAENTTLLEDQKSTVSELPAAPLEDEDNLHIQPDDCTQSPEILPSGVILVQPVTTKIPLLLEDQKSTVSELPAAPLEDEDSLHIQPDDCTQSPEILPSGVILVQPVTTKIPLLLEDQKSIVSEPPAAPLKDEDSLHIQPDDCNPSPDVLPSGVILVRPATAENTTLLEDQEIPVSFQSGLNKTSESSVSNADSNTKISSCGHVDSTTCEDTGTKKKGKKNKNCFRRVLSWLRKRFSCRVSPTD